MMFSKQRLREVLELKRAAVDRILKDIETLHSAPSRKYIQEFHDEFQTFQSLCDPEAVLNHARSANLIWVGDYHALSKSQTYASAFIQRLAAYNPNLAMGVEPVFARQQRFLDGWSRGRIGEQEFLNRIRYREEWGCDWSSYRTLFDTAHELNIPIHGIDCHPRHDMRSIGRRDESVARRIASIIERDPARTLVVVFGESHLASNHLPRRVRAILGRKGLPRKELTVLQNVDSIYWQLQERGIEHGSAVRMADSSYCVFNATPIEKYESFRRYLHNCVEEDSADDWASLTQTLTEVLLDFLDLKQTETISNYMPAPEVNSMAQVAEEFTRFMHQACRGELERPAERSEGDRFFVEVLESALGYFCSKLFDSSRDGIEALTVRTLSQLGYNEPLIKAVAVLVDPARRPNAQHFAAIRAAAERITGRSKARALLNQLLGYALGRRLYYAYLGSQISRKDIHALFHDPLKQRHRPLKCYIELTERLVLDS